jgi:putative phosphoribosyl transferase
MWFADRAEAGRLLARELQRFAAMKPVVLGLVRGGIPVGYQAAVALPAPLDVVLVRKIGVPWQPELALGAIVDGEAPEQVIDEGLVRLLDIPSTYIEEEVRRQSAEIERRRKLYVGDRASVPIEGATAIVVDDGIATGASMRVALRGIRRRGPARLVMAVPVAAADSLASLREEADDIVCLAAPEAMGAVGQFYGDFRGVEDAEVIALLEKARRAEGNRRR